MKLVLLVLLVAIVPVICLCQGTSLVVWVDTSAVAKKATMTLYDSLYTPAGSFLSGDSIGSAWYGSFRPAFEQRIQDAHLMWPETTQVWIDLCCDSSGKVEHVLLRSKQLKNDEFGAIFQKELSTFVRGYVFPLRADKRYSQCGTLKFPVKDRK
jgi:hypothetical protein